MKFCLIVLIIIVTTFSSCIGPVDIRNEYLKSGVTEKDKQKGLELLLEIEKAYGGREVWDSYENGNFIQIANWYGRKKISNWDTLPQKFEMMCELGSNNGILKLLDGKNKEDKYWIEQSTFFQKLKNDNKIETEYNQYHEKMIFKSYWFQFPFRVKEAEHITYAGEEKINGKTYNLLYATWGSMEANDDFDQFIIYVDKKTNLIELLHFTVRDKMGKLSLTSRFENFRPVDNLVLPFSQYVKYGKPQEEGVKIHENHYIDIHFESITTQ